MPGVLGSGWFDPSHPLSKAATGAGQVPGGSAHRPSGLQRRGVPTHLGLPQVDGGLQFVAVGFWGVFFFEGSPTFWGFKGTPRRTITHFGVPMGVLVGTVQLFGGSIPWFLFFGKSTS